MVPAYKVIYANGGIASRGIHSMTFYIQQTFGLADPSTLQNMDALAAGVASMLKSTAVVLGVIVSNAYNDNGTKATKGPARSKEYAIAGGRAAAAAPGGAPAGTQTVLPAYVCLAIARSSTLGRKTKALMRFAVDTGDVIVGANSQYKLTATAQASLDTALAAFSTPTHGTFVVPHAKGGAPRVIESMAVSGVVDNDPYRRRENPNVKLAKGVKAETNDYWQKFQDLLDDYANGGITYDVVQTAYTAIVAATDPLLAALPLAARLALKGTQHPQLPPPPSGP